MHRFGPIVLAASLQPGTTGNVTIAADGQLRGYVPVPTLAPFEIWILEFSRIS